MFGLIWKILAERKVQLATASTRFLDLPVILKYIQGGIIWEAKMYLKNANKYLQ